MRDSLAHACVRAQELADRSAALMRDSHERLLVSHPQACYASVEVVVDGVPTAAMVRRDGTAVVGRALQRRVELLEALGEVLAAGRRARVGRDALTSVLTIVRACDLVRSVRFADRASVGVAVVAADDLLPTADEPPDHGAGQPDLRP